MMAKHMKIDLLKKIENTISQCCSKNRSAVKLLPHIKQSLTTSIYITSEINQRRQFSECKTTHFV